MAAERSCGKALQIIELGTNWDWLAPAALSQEIYPIVRTGCEAWWLPQLIRTFSGREKYLIPATNRTPISFDVF